jgi:hypothetical protein
MENYTQTGKGRLFIKRNNPNTCNKYQYNGCVSVGGVSTTFGTPSTIYCPSESRYDEFEVVASIRSTSVDRPSLTLKSYLPMNRRSTFESLVKSTCTFDLQLHYGDCSIPSDFSQFTRAFHFKNAVITEYALSDLAASSPDNRAVVEETLTVSVDSFTSIVNVKPVFVSTSTTLTQGPPVAVVEIQNNNQLCSDCDEQCCFAVLSCIGDVDDCIVSKMELKLICGNSTAIAYIDCLPSTTDIKMFSTSKYLYITADNQLFKFEIEDILAVQSEEQTLSCLQVTTSLDACGGYNSITSPECWNNTALTFNGIWYDDTDDILYAITPTTLVKFDDNCLPTTIATYTSTAVAISGNGSDGSLFVALTDGRVYKYVDGLNTLILTVTEGFPISLYVIDKSNVVIGTTTGLYRVCYNECIYKAIGGCVRKIKAFDADILYILVEYATSSNIYMSLDGGFSLSALTDDPYLPSNFIGKTITDIALCESDPHNYIAIGIDRMLGCGNSPICDFAETGFLMYGTA